jgi:hypothetical protein
MKDEMVRGTQDHQQDPPRALRQASGKVFWRFFHHAFSFLVRVTVRFRAVRAHFSCDAHKYFLRA